MFVSPIIERELRQALRKHKAVRSRLGAAAGGAGVVFFFLLIGSLGGFRSVGGELHKFLFYLGLAMAVIPPASISVGLFSEERRNQTMELLYLAGLKPGELFGGKLLGGTLAASCNLLALAPFLAMPFLSGGISLDLFLATIGCFPALLLFVTGVGVLASVLCKDEGMALICAIVIGGVLCLAIPIPYMMGKMLTGVPPFSAEWLALSPAFGPYLVAQHFGGHKPEFFWTACGMTLGWAVICLGIAALLLSGAGAQSWSGRTAWAGARPGRAGFMASETWRTKLRRRLLGINPFQWLVEQDRRPVAAAWGIVAGVCSVWLLGWGTWPRVWPSPTTLYAAAMLLIVGMELVMAYAGARRLGHDRRDGVLELVLTTPLMPEQMVDGQMAGMKAVFRPVRWTVFGLCALMALGGLATRVWSTEALISYGLIWCLLLWWSVRGMRYSTPQAMWIGVNSGRPAMAIFRRQNLWWWASMAFNFRNFTRIFSGRAINFPSGSAVELIVVCVVSFCVLCIAAVTQMSKSKMRERLIAEMRSIAREPVPEAHDPRFKKWVVNERLPRSAYHEMTERVASYPQRMADAERARNVKAGG
jgi:ABC-type transport system involved in multi-copper enzyme maturation permease subunit